MILSIHKSQYDADKERLGKKIKNIDKNNT